MGEGCFNVPIIYSILQMRLGQLFLHRRRGNNFFVQQSYEKGLYFPLFN